MNHKITLPVPDYWPSIFVQPVSKVWTCSILSAFEYLSDFDHYIVAKTLKKLNDMNSHDKTSAVKKEYKKAIKTFRSFQVLTGNL